MIICYLRIFLVFITIFCLQSCSENKTGNIKPIKAEDLLAHDLQPEAALSADGMWLAFTKTVSGQVQFFAKDLSNQKIFNLPFPKGGLVRQLRWTPKNKLLFTVLYPGEYSKHLFIISPGESNPFNLSPFDQAVVRNYHLLEQNEDEIVVIMSHRSNQFFDAYRINLNNGSAKLVGLNNGSFTTFIPNNLGDVLCALSVEGKISSLWHRETESQPFKRVFTTSFYERILPIKYNKNNSYIYALSNLGRDKRALVLLDPTKGKELIEIFKSKNVDLDRVVYKAEQLMAVNYHDDYPQQVILDLSIREIIKQVKDQFPNNVFVELTDVTANKDGFLFKVWSDVEPGTYYYYNSTQTKLESISEKLVFAETLSHTKAIGIKNRHGFDIPCYITHPVGGGRAQVPAVIIPNPGFSTRHIWEYNPLVQFLASRGYLVLQVNCHGANGYGIRYAQSGYKEMNNLVISDIADAVNFLISNGLSNAHSIGILGNSIGGTLALNFVANYPEMVQLAISRDGIIDLQKMLTTPSPRMLPYKEMLAEIFGSPLNDSALIKKTSPLNNLKNCIRPVLIAQSARNTRTGQLEIDSAQRILKATQTPFEFVAINNNLPPEQSIQEEVAYFKAIEKFLQRYLF